MQKDIKSASWHAFDRFYEENKAVTEFHRQISEDHLSFNKEAANQWLATLKKMHSESSQKNAPLWASIVKWATAVVEQTQRVSAAQFDRTCGMLANRIISELNKKENAEVVVYHLLRVLNKSYLWMALKMWPLLRHVITHVVSPGSDNEIVFEPYRWNGIYASFHIFVDDALYSGDQMSKNMPDIMATLQDVFVQKSWLTNHFFLFGTCFATDYGISRVKHELKEMYDIRIPERNLGPNSDSKSSADSANDSDYDLDEVIETEEYNIVHVKSIDSLVLDDDTQAMLKGAGMPEDFYVLPPYYMCYKIPDFLSSLIKVWLRCPVPVVDENSNIVRFETTGSMIDGPTDSDLYQGDIAKESNYKPFYKSFTYRANGAPVPKDKDLMSYLMKSFSSVEATTDSRGGPSKRAREDEPRDSEPSKKQRVVIEIIDSSEEEEEEEEEARSMLGRFSLAQQ